MHNPFMPLLDTHLMALKQADHAAWALPAQSLYVEQRQEGRLHLPLPATTNDC